MILKKRTSFKENADRSIIIRLIRAISGIITSAFRRSLTGKISVSDGREDDLYDSCFLKNIFRTQSRRNSAPKKLRRLLSSSIEKSRILGILRMLSKLFFAIRLRSIGFFLLSYSFFATLVWMIKYYPFDGSGWGVEMFAIIAILSPSIPFMFSRQNVAEAISDSKLFSAVLSDGLGIDLEQKKRDAESIPSYSKYFGIAPILGILFGSLSVLISPDVFLVAVVAVISVAFIFSKPEAGVLLTVFALPFGEMLNAGGVDLVAVSVIVTTVSFAFKVILGNREIHFDLSDIFMLLVLIVTASCCFGNAGAENYSHITRVVIFMLMYFLFVNLVKTRGWLLRSANAFVFSLCVTLVIGVTVPMLTHIPYFRTFIMDSNIFDAVYMFSRQSANVYILLPAIPFLLAATSSSLPGRKGTYSVYLLLAVICITVGGNPIAHPAMLVTLAVYVLCTNPNLIFLGIPLYMIRFASTDIRIPLISEFLSESKQIYSEAINENIYVMNGTMRALEDYLFTGIGFEGGSFAKIYPNYAYAGFENASDAGSSMLQLLLGFGIFGFAVIAVTVVFFLRRIFGSVARLEDAKEKNFLSACAASITGYAVAACYDNIFTTDTVFMYIFIMAAMTAAYTRIVKNERNRRSIRHSDTCDHVDMLLPAQRAPRKK